MYLKNLTLQMKNNIQDYIINIIKNHGPLTIDRIIQISSNYYYSNFDSIGEKSDFITAPEISQMFGEIVAIYLIDTWYRKFNKPLTLVELGPGNGTMMHDILRTAKQFKNFYSNIKEVALIETSPYLVNKQKSRLKDFNNLNITWYTNIDHVKGDNYLIIANEFFDALPIKQFYYKDNKIFEVVISLSDNKLIYGLIENSSNLITNSHFKNSQFIEISDYRKKYTDHISKKISNDKSIALIIDYGYLKNPNKSTLQAVKNHKKVNLLDNIGYADITSLVNFTDIKNDFIKNNISSNILDQSEFLTKNGIIERAESLIKSRASREKINFQLNKLIANDEMGTLFKVLTTSPTF